ncbi:MAG: hypothetical protein H0V29_09395 [Thermoleophilaceae bacterium]|nr:hypothetical protein [Thermoleophilaceae bacterium]
MQGARRSKQQISKRNAQLVGLLGFLAAAALPLLLWHEPIRLIASEFRLDPTYLLTGWSGYALIVAGLLFFVPVVLSIGRNPSGRFYPRARNAYAAWGISLYLLGAALAVQVAQITTGPLGS